jgi:hypothetical protein
MRMQMVVEGTAPNSHVRGLGGVGAGKGRGVAAAKMASRKVKPVLVVDGEVTRLEVRVRVEEAKQRQRRKRVSRVTSHGWGWWPEKWRE